MPCVKKYLLFKPIVLKKTVIIITNKCVIAHYHVDLTSASKHISHLDMGRSLQGIRLMQPIHLQL